MRLFCAIIGFDLSYNNAFIVRLNGQCKNISLNTIFPNNKTNNDNIIFENREFSLNDNSLDDLGRWKPDVLIFVYSLHDINCGLYKFKDYIVELQCIWNISDDKPIIIFVNAMNNLLKDLNYTNTEVEGFCDKYGFRYYEINQDSPNENIDMIYSNMAKDWCNQKFPITFRNIDHQKHNKICNNFGNILYDTLIIFISFADLGTDLCVLYQYYINGRGTFFIIGLIFIIIAQLAYCYVFIEEYTNFYWRKSQILCLFLGILPFSWILSVVMYMGEKSAWFRNAILTDKFGFTTPTAFKKYESKTDAYNWAREKLFRHIGFILESVLEALPQAILQIIAIVIYKETNISILLSMISVSTKALIFSKSIDNGIFLWNWLCACAVK